MKNRLLEKVAFDYRVQEPNVTGGVETAWSLDADAYKCRARFKYLRGTETVIAARLSGVQPVVVKIRRNERSAAITPAWRMRDRTTGAVFAIKSIIPSENRRYFELTCNRGETP